MSEPVRQLVSECQYAKDQGTPEHHCAVRCVYEEKGFLAAIEQAAQVAERYDEADNLSAPKAIASAIRAFKDMDERKLLYAHPPRSTLAPAPAQHVDPSREGCVGAMTADRAIYFLRRFKADEKMLGPHEQWALDFTIAALSPSPQTSATTHRDPLPSDADDMGDGAGGVAKGGVE